MISSGIALFFVLLTGLLTQTFALSMPGGPACCCLCPVLPPPPPPGGGAGGIPPAPPELGTTDGAGGFGGAGGYPSPGGFPGFGGAACPGGVPCCVSLSKYFYQPNERNEKRWHPKFHDFRKFLQNHLCDLDQNFKFTADTSIRIECLTLFESQYKPVKKFFEEQPSQTQ